MSFSTHNRAHSARVLTIVTATVLILLLIRHFYGRGGPYFDIPETIEDRVAPRRVMCRRVEGLMPRGATVTVLAPKLAPNYDATHYLVASGLLPHHHVVAPPVEDAWPDFAIALGAPFEHEKYRLERQFAEGRLYAIKR
jgi:hypothetical protein